MLAQEGAAPRSMRKTGPPWIDIMEYRMHCRDKLGRKIQKGMLEKVTRQLQEPLRDRIEPLRNLESQCPQLPEQDHQELVGESVGSCHLVFRHFLTSIAKNVVVAHAAVREPGGSKAEPAWHPTLALPHVYPADLWGDGGYFLCFPHWHFLGAGLWEAELQLDKVDSRTIPLSSPGRDSQMVCSGDSYFRDL